MNIKELAEQAGFEYSSQWTYWTAYENELERFAELVRQDYANQFITDAERDENIRSEERRHLAGHYSAIMRDAVLAEREACAKLCESEGARIDASWESCAAAIRARWQK
jgi:hypothetical protein